MDTRQLRYFAAVFEQRNLSHAANLCNVAQSAISHHIASLEDQLGVPLFQRKPRGMEPTSAGVRLYDHARQILHDLAVAEQDLKSLPDQVTGDIVVGMPYSTIEGIGLPLMQAVMSDYPGVRLSIVEGLSGVTFQSLLSADVDVALFYNPPADGRVVFEPLVEEEILCVGRKEIVGDTSDPIRFAELAELPVLLLRQGVSSRALLDRPALLGALHAPVPLELNSVNGFTKALLAGIGCAISPNITVRNHIASGELVARPVIEPPLKRSLSMGRMAENLPTRLSEAIGDLIKTLVRREVTSGAWQAKLLA